MLSNMGQILSIIKVGSGRQDIRIRIISPEIKGSGSSGLCARGVGVIIDAPDLHALARLVSLLHGFSVKMRTHEIVFQVS